MDLDGEWLATEADDDVRRYGIGLDATTDDWAPVTVPGHWRHHADFADSDGPIMYRRTFRTEPPRPDRRRWLLLEGILYQADVWLDGAYLGDPEGYFFPHEFDITALSQIGEEHVVAMEVACEPQRELHGRRNLTGVLQQGLGLDERFNPGGIWRSVRIAETGPVRIDRLRLLCRDADERRAHLRVTARLDSIRQCTATVRSSLDGEVWDEQEHGLASGENDLEWTLDVVDPALWWPRALGERPLVEVAVEVIVDEETSDRHVRTTGLRQITWNNWICSVNGERLFLKGANLLPTSLDLAGVGPEAVRRDVTAAVDLGLDALRVHGHIGHPELYRAADEAGILLLQDFPLLWGHARAVRGQAVHQARATVDVLGHHPSIALWNAHDDPGGRDVAAASPRRFERTRALLSEQLPSWNRTILDRWVKRSFERNDPTRTTIAHSGVPPHLPLLDGTDSHVSFGWHQGVAADLARFAARMPRMVRFVSDFGADSVPCTAPFLEEQLREHEWPDLDWELLTERNGYDRAAFEARLPPAEQPDAARWREATQHYQAHVLKVQIETLRRLKYRPTGGFAFSRLADPAPLISSSILDHARVPKHAHAVVRAACAPVAVVATEPPPAVAPGERLRLDVHLVSDLRDELPAAEVVATVRWTGGERRWRFGGPVPADDVVKVGRIDLDVPDAPGALAIELAHRAGEHTGVNRYATTIQSMTDT